MCTVFFACRLATANAGLSARPGTLTVQPATAGTEINSRNLQEGAMSAALGPFYCWPRMSKTGICKPVEPFFWLATG